MHVLILVATVTLCERDDITREQTNQYVLPVVISQPGSTPSVWHIPPGLVARLPYDCISLIVYAIPWQHMYAYGIAAF